MRRGGRIYSANGTTLNLSTGKILAGSTPAAKAVEIISWRFGQTYLLTDANTRMIGMRLEGWSTAATGGASLTSIYPHNVGSPAAGSSFLYNFATAGTFQRTLWGQSFDLRHGVVYEPDPDQRPWIPPGGYFGFWFQSGVGVLYTGWALTFAEHD